MKSKSFTVLMLALFALSCSLVSFAQDQNMGNMQGNQEKKPLSPPAKAETTIGGKKVVVDYSAPSMRGRKIMGGLVPYDQVWRTGANAATTLTTEVDLNIGGATVPKGTYTLFTLPSAGTWKLIISKRLKDANGKPMWGAFEYDEKQDLARVDMKKEATSAPVETFKISFVPGEMVMEWENTKLSVPVTEKK